MLSRLFQQQAKRAFSSSTTKMVAHEHFKEGVYSNIPFKVHNRRIPYAVPHITFFALGLGVPVLALVIQFNRSGDIKLW
ncbi:DEKNAAC100745 [Brettanomyces naardenensis]|uniref:Cytochrome c oxidase subunit 8, mitochondrial n=1 Tax=Brettanomyces naardenensis TaxID=13370 RepID=A0A448YG80_BRENA|nr:DEKNAAC100745 [Brettanomyces naardenensis]